MRATSIRLSPDLLRTSSPAAIRISASMESSHSPFRYELEVGVDGRLEVAVPLPAGAHVTVFVVEQPADEFADFVASAGSSLEFWDNPFDDEDWDAASAG